MSTAITEPDARMSASNDRVNSLMSQDRFGRRLLVLALLACTIEGALRKWVIPESSLFRYFAYFSKDLILCQVFWIKVQDPLVDEQYRWQQVLRVGVMLVIIGAGLSMVVGGLNPVGAVLTLRSTVGLPLLALAISRRLPVVALRDAMQVIALVAIPMAALGVWQFYSSPTSWVNQYAIEGSGAVTSGFDTRVRATGTFAYITGFGNFAIVAIACGIGFHAMAGRERGRRVGLAAILAGLICQGTTVSRAVALGAVGILGGVAFNTKVASRSIWWFSAVAGVLWCTLAVFNLSSDRVSEILSSAQRRHAHLGSRDTFGKRITRPLVGLGEAISLAPMGNGLGTEQIAGAYYNAGSMGFNHFEDEAPRVVMELGTVGFAGFLVVYFGSLFALYQRYAAVLQLSGKTALWATLLACGVLWLEGVAFNHTSSFYFWCLLGAAMASCRLATSAARA